MELLSHIILSLLMGFVNIILLPWHIYNWLKLPTLKEQLNTFVLAGMSQEFFYMMTAFILILLAAGIVNRRFLRSTVFGLERFNGALGKAACWFALLMMLQQVLIIVMGQVFRGNDLIFSPFGLVLSDNQLQWYSGQLKFYNAILIAVASAYTFIEGGHVRVDLFYNTVSYRTQKWIDLVGTLIFLFPSAVLLWWFSWPIALNSLFAQRPLNIWSTQASWRGMRFESSGTAEFTWVWAFKLLIVVFAGLLFILAVSFLLRNVLALLSKDEEIPAHYSFDGQRPSLPHSTQ